MPLQSKLKYRPDIDGLRAIAVLAVVFFHAFPNYISGGFIGVDIFFVISGFLITSILLKDFENNSFSFLTFYARRFRRILPALIVVLVGTWLIAQRVFLPSEFRLLGKHMLASAFFVENFVLFREAGYFDLSSDFKPLLHLWSLSVEEQFYLIWPLILVLSYHSKFKTCRVLSAIGLGSFLINILLVRTWPSAIFYLLPSRLWELASGAGLSYCLFGPSRNKYLSLPVWLKELFSWVSLICIVAAAFSIKKNPVYPGWLGALPVLSALILIGVGPNTLISNYVLSNRLLVWIGKISYPVYLWHWSLLSIARIASESPITNQTTLFLILLTFILSWLTYWIVETPIRKIEIAYQGQQDYSWQLVIGSLTCLVLIGAVGVLSERSNILFTSEQKKLLSLEHASNLYRQEGEKVIRSSGDKLDGSESPGKKVLLWGDSIAAQFFPTLQSKGSVLGATVLAQTGCPPLLEFLGNECLHWNEQIAERIGKIRPDVVLLAANWYEVLSDKNDISRSLDKTVTKLRHSGVKNIILIGAHPFWIDSTPDMLIRRFLRRNLAIPERLDGAIPKDKAMLNDSISRYTKREGIHFISLSQVLCNSSGCLVRRGPDFDRDLINWDRNHLAAKGLQFVEDTTIVPMLKHLLYGPTEATDATANFN